MSGKNCPDCGSFEIYSVDQTTDECRFCGWMGPTRPRRQLTRETMHSMMELNKKNKELRDAGMLFFLRVYTKSPDGILKVKGSLGEIFDIQEGLKQNLKQSYVFLRMNHRPTPNEIKKLKDLEETERIQLV